MADLAHSFDSARPWVPDQLTATGKSRRPEISVVPDQGDGTPEITVVPDVGVPDIVSLNPGAIEWLGARVRDSVEGSISIKDVLLQGRDLIPDDVLRKRAVHRGVMLLPEFHWNGPDDLAGAQIAKLAHTHQRLLATNGDEARTLRFRARLQAMDLESTLISYAATEFVDPRILDRQLSLEVLCHSARDMTPEVIVRLGLARAHLDEIDDEMADSAFLLDDLWPVVQQAWHREMLNAKSIATKWAEKVVTEGRAGALAWRRN